jgi:hypothetical protein
MSKPFTTAKLLLTLLIPAGMLGACNSTAKKTADADSSKIDTGKKVKFISQPLISSILRILRLTYLTVKFIFTLHMISTPASPKMITAIILP